MASKKKATEGWESVDLEDAIGFGVGSVLKSCMVGDMALSTVGDLADFLSRHGMKEIPGVGPATAELIRNELAKFFSRSNQWTCPEELKP